jgi:hypothetical protein
MEEDKEEVEKEENNNKDFFDSVEKSENPVLQQ